MDQKKDASTTALAAFFVVFGIWLISVVFVGGPLAALITAFVDPEGTSEQTFWIVYLLMVVLWTIAGPLFLTGYADRHWWQKRNGCREMDELERARLLPLWDEVCHRAGLSPHAYRLVMTSQPTVNAFATGDSMVSIDQGMLAGLGDPELKAVIAHELGHHTKRHVGAIVLKWWYGWPTEIVITMLMMLARVSVFLLVPALVLSFIFRGTTLLMRVIDRRTEFEADDYAKDLGMGREMSSALGLMKKAYPEMDLENESFLDRLMRTHPTVDDRIERLAEGS
jgi:Zn-dependent protease with chaperone function